jgi:hypothetical protein
LTGEPSVGCCPGPRRFPSVGREPRVGREHRRHYGDGEKSGGIILDRAPARRMLGCGNLISRQTLEKIRRALIVEIPCQPPRILSSA